MGSGDASHNAPLKKRLRTEHHLQSTAADVGAEEAHDEVPQRDEDSHQGRQMDESVEAKAKNRKQQQEERKKTSSSGRSRSPANRGDEAVPELRSAMSSRSARAVVQTDGQGPKPAGREESRPDRTGHSGASDPMDEDDPGSAAAAEAVGSGTGDEEGKTVSGGHQEGSHQSEQEGAAALGFPESSLVRVPTDWEVDPGLDIAAAALAALRGKDHEALDGVLDGCLRMLGEAPPGSSPPKYPYLSAVFISKKIPTAFALPKSYGRLLEMLGAVTKPAGGGGGGHHGGHLVGGSNSSSSSLMGPSAAVKRSQPLALLAASLLMRALEPLKEWPVELPLALIDDLFGARRWSEADASAEFVGNLLTAIPSASRDKQKQGAGGSESARIAAAAAEAGVSMAPNDSLLRRPKKDLLGRVEARFRRPEDLRAVKEAFLTRLGTLVASTSARENIKACVKVLKLACGYPEGRAAAASQLEGVLNNPSLQRGGQQVLEVLLHELPASSTPPPHPSDLAAAKSIVSMRLKSNMSALFTRTVQSVCCASEGYLLGAMRLFVSQDILERNKVHAMGCISAVVRAVAQQQQQQQQQQQLPEGACEAALGLCLQECIAQPEAKPRVREFVQRLLKASLPDLKASPLCRALMEEWSPVAQLPQPQREAWLGEVMATVNLVQVVAACAVTGEALASKPPQDPSQTPSGAHLLESCSALALEAVVWSRTVVTPLLPGLSPDRYVYVVRRLLFLQAERNAYFTPGEPFGEVEAAGLQMMQWQVPVLEDTLTHVMLMGLAPDQPLAATDALSIAEALLRRMAAQHLVGRGPSRPPVTAENTELVDAIFKLAVLPRASSSRKSRGREEVKKEEVKHEDGLEKEDIKEEEGVKEEEDEEEMAPMAVPAVWWRAQLSALLLCVLNMATVGKDAVSRLPQLRRLCELLITQSSAHAAALHSDETMAARVAEADRSGTAELIRSYEASGEPLPEGLSGASGDAGGGGGGEGPVLLSVRLPGGGEDEVPDRVPPDGVVAELLRMDQAYNLGYHLRSCRDPPLFSELLQRYENPRAAWQWLRGVLSSDPAALEALPPQWLPEILVQVQQQQKNPQQQLPDVALRAAESIRQSLVAAAPGTEAESEASESLRCLASRLADLSAAVRRGAQQCISLVLLLPQQQQEGGDAPQQQEQGGPGAWLEALLRMPAGSQLAGALCPPVAAALQAEKDPSTIVAYLEFLRLRSSSSSTSSTSCVDPAAAVSRLFVTKPLTARWLLGRSPQLVRAALRTLLRAFQGGGGASKQGSDVFKAATVLLEASAALLAESSEAESDELRAMFEALVQQVCVRGDEGSSSGAWILKATKKDSSKLLEDEMDVDDGNDDNEEEEGLDIGACLALARASDPRLAEAGAHALPPAALVRLAAAPSSTPESTSRMLQALDGSLEGGDVGSRAGGLRGVVEGLTGVRGLTPQYLSTSVAASQSRLLLRPGEGGPRPGDTFKGELERHVASGEGIAAMEIDPQEDSKDGGEAANVAGPESSSGVEGLKEKTEATLAWLFGAGHELEEAGAPPECCGSLLSALERVVRGDGGAGSEALEAAAKRFLEEASSRSGELLALGRDSKRREAAVRIFEILAPSRPEAARLLARSAAATAPPSPHESEDDDESQAAGAVVSLARVPVARLRRWLLRRLKESAEEPARMPGLVAELVDALQEVSTTSISDHDAMDEGDSMTGDEARVRAQLLVESLVTVDPEVGVSDEPMNGLPPSSEQSAAPMSSLAISALVADAVRSPRSSLQISVASTLVAHILRHAGWRARVALGDAMLLGGAGSSQNINGSSGTVTAAGPPGSSAVVVHSPEALARLGHAASLRLDSVMAVVQHPRAWSQWQAPEGHVHACGGATSSTASMPTVTFSPRSGRILAEAVLAESCSGSESDAALLPPTLKPLLVYARRDPEGLSEVASFLAAEVMYKGDRMSISSGSSLNHQRRKRAAAGQLLHALYLAFPAAVLNGLEKKGQSRGSSGAAAAVLRSAAALGSSVLQSHALSGLACGLFSRVAAGVAPEEEPGSAQAAAQAAELSARHPSLLLPHIAALAGSLFPDLEALNNVSPERRAATLRTLSRILEILDALTPELLRQCNRRRKRQQQQQNGSNDSTNATLETAAALCLALLAGLKPSLRSEAQAIPCAARAADFLCACMASGGAAAKAVAQEIARADDIYENDGDPAPLEERMPVSFPTVQKLILLLDLLRVWRRNTKTKQLRGVLREEEEADGEDKGDAAEEDEESEEEGEASGGGLKLEAALRQSELVAVQLSSSLALERSAKEALLRGLGPLEGKDGTELNLPGIAAPRDSVPPIKDLLDDIEAVAKRIPRLLAPMVPPLLRLVATGCLEAPERAKGYQLLRRHLEGSSAADLDPDVPIRVGEVVLDALRTGQTPVGESAVQAAPDLLQFLPHHKRGIMIELLRHGAAATLPIWGLSRPQ